MCLTLQAVRRVFRHMPKPQRNRPRKTANGYFIVETK
jgi:hypothetical protein